MTSIGAAFAIARLNTFWPTDKWELLAEYTPTWLIVSWAVPLAALPAAAIVALGLLMARRILLIPLVLTGASIALGALGGLAYGVLFDKQGQYQGLQSYAYELLLGGLPAWLFMTRRFRAAVNGSGDG
jgi:hypothetical protein